MEPIVEYRVRPVTRYLVTRHEIGATGVGRLTEHGEYGNAHLGYEVAYALCRAEHERLGWPLGDERIQYPDPASQYHGGGQMQEPHPDAPVFQSQLSSTADA